MSKKVPGGFSTRPANERLVEQCIALIDYDALTTDEISFRAGDVINVTGKGSASGFWEGHVAVPTLPAMATVEAGSDSERDASLSSSVHPRSRPPHGLFPNCLVTSNMRFKSSLTNNACQNVALCLYTYHASGEGEMSFAPGDVITALRPSASPGWWYGTKSAGPAWRAPSAAADAKAARAGAALSPTPSSPRFANPATAAAAASDGDGSVAQTAASLLRDPQELLFPTNFVTCDVVLITFNFVGRQAHELSCRSGDVVQVHRRWNDGWWEGSLGDRRGIFPSNYSVPNMCTTSPPLFCSRCRSVYPSNTFQSTCATCAAEEHIEDIMLQSLEAYVRGETATYDLFAGIDIGPLNDADGPSNVDERNADLLVKAASGDEDLVGSSIGKTDTSVRKENSIATPRAAAAVGSASARSRGHGSVAENLEFQGSTRPRARATLLTDKDLAELASNRVKLME